MMGLSIAPRLWQRQKCAICDSLLPDEDERLGNLKAIALFGINIRGWIKQGHCPAPWCLGDATFQPRTVLKRWKKHTAVDQPSHQS